jgi:hypothetical protein
MNKIYLLLLTVFFISCQTKEQKENDQYNKTVDEYYDKFKTEIASDSLSMFAENDAEYVAQFHYDSLKKQEAKVWLVKYNNYIKSIDENIKNEKANDQAFLARNLKLSKTLHKDEQCNFLQQHILVSTYTDNKDTLTKAVKILTDSIWSSIPFSNECVKNIRCGVYLYKKGKDFELNGWRKWFVMATKITGEDVTVRFE